MLQRYDATQPLPPYNVIEGALEGGVNESLNLDAHGKCLSFRILAIAIPDLP